MKVRHAAVVAGLALGLMSGKACASVTYTLDIPLGLSPITGSLTTNGSPGFIDGSVSQYDFIYNTVGEVTSADGFRSSPGNVLYAAGTNLYFDAEATSTTGFYDDTENGVVAFNGSSRYNNILFEVYPGMAEQTGYKGFVLIGTSDVNVGGSLPPLSSVPLPSSAPMFGAALLVLGTVGYGLKGSELLRPEGTLRS